MNITKTNAWNALLQHRDRLQHVHLRQLFAEDTQRFSHFSAQLDGLLIDYSKQRVDRGCMVSLIDLARAADVEAWRDRMFAGEKINVSEDRAVLHTALRHMDATPFPCNEHDEIGRAHV